MKWDCEQVWCLYDLAIEMVAILRNLSEGDHDHLVSHAGELLMQVLAETIDKCSCDDDCACEALTLKQGGIWNPVHTNASKCLQIGRSPEVMLLSQKIHCISSVVVNQNIQAGF